MGAWFLGAFLRHANALNVAIYDRLEFVRAFLGEQIESPTPASCVKEITPGSPGLTWLVEFKRSSTVECFMYTLTQINKAGSAKQHYLHLCSFVWGHSNKRDSCASPRQGTDQEMQGILSFLSDNDSEEPATPDVPGCEDDPIDQQNLLQRSQFLSSLQFSGYIGYLVVC
ncbi:hypothetical protein MSAN_01769900 [Mycena sanguinolenta]|uniref:Uncharacterized protein n=1 Tax=Mycena sanguinolenta TaxID=230812 RepID=A0A8H6XXQ5_9AGAR|nr:hypothetical protein MSAN_01769900 [Mycena sanguinolenta]